MGQFQKDIKTIRSLFEQEPYSSSLWGTLVFNEYPGTYFDDKESWTVLDHFVQKSIANAAPDSRVGLVYLDRACKETPQAYSAAAHDCLDNIGAIFIVSPQIRRITPLPLLSALSFDSSPEGLARYFLSNLPKKLFEANFPIVFDEVGVLSEFSPKSECVYSNRISFRRFIDNIDNSYVFFQGDDYTGNTRKEEGYSSWLPCVFPFVRISDKEDAWTMSKPIHKRSLDALAEESGYDDAEELCEVVKMMAHEMPSWFDDLATKVFTTCGTVKRGQKQLDFYCPMAIDKDDFPEYESAMHEIDRASKILKLYDHAVIELYGIDEYVYLWNKGKLQSNKFFRETCEKTCLSHQVAALDAGVPIEDILA